MKVDRPYTIVIKRSAEKEMDRLPGEAFDRVSEAILSLESNPRHKGAKKLSSSSQYRLRVGPYRVLYVIHDPERIVEILAVGHRREVYRIR